MKKSELQKLVRETLLQESHGGAKNLIDLALLLQDKEAKKIMIEVLDNDTALDARVAKLSQALIKIVQDYV